MEKELRTSLYVEDAVKIEAELEDFDGTVEEWKKAFYDVWRLEMTWSFAHKIELIERRDGVVMILTIKPSYKKALVGTLEGLHYRNIKVEDVYVGIVQTYELTDPITEDMFVVVND